MMGRALFAALFVTGLLSGAAMAGNTPISKDARAYIVWPKNGMVIHGGKLWVRMGIKNAGVAPAGEEGPNTGHHHLIIDAPLPPLDQEIPSDQNHLHFGGGQTEVRLELPPGKHTLQLLFADFEHVPHNPPVYSEQITIIVP
jgi:hypothetical protein